MACEGLQGPSRLMGGREHPCCEEHSPGSISRCQRLCLIGLGSRCPPEEHGQIAAVAAGSRTPAHRGHGLLCDLDRELVSVFELSRSLMVSSSHPALCPFPSQFSPLPNPSAFSLSLLQMSQITRLSMRRKFWTSRRMITSISHATRLRKTPTRYEQISSADTKRVLSMVRPLQWCCVWQNQALQHRGFAPEVSQGWRVEAEGEELQRGSGWVWGRQQQRWTVK